MKIEELSFGMFPPLLKEIPDPPEKLYKIGAPVPDGAELITVVGSRSASEYGRRATESIVAGLRDYGVVIVSGLALGIDAVAHRAALRHGLRTVAIPGSGLSSKHIYPRSNRGLAEEIIKKGGTLLSEFEPEAEVFPSNFPQRNRIMAGISRATLVIEAAEKSGTLITARLALDYNRDVFAVPGSIFSKTSLGTNALIRDGALPVSSADDIVAALALKKKDARAARSGEESGVFFKGDSISKDDFFKTIGDSHAAQTLLSKLELERKVVVKGDIIFRV
jgi:DNA processing protein